jgi:hypothetical protein
MRCSNFLQLYSDYRDGLIEDPRLEGDVRQHLTECSRCMDYDASIARGVMLLKATSDIGPSLRFTRRLKSRLSQDDGESEVGENARSVHAGIMVVLMMAAAIALAVGIRSDPVDERTQAGVARATPVPATMSNSGSGGGLLDLTGLSVPAFGTEVTASPISQLSFTTWVSLSR